MRGIVEVDVLKNWTLSIDHFYSIIKGVLGNISTEGRYQIQATAIPLDISEDYEWFSRGILNLAFDSALEPIPAADNMSTGLQLRTKFSSEYRALLSRALLLVETAELDEDVVKKIDELELDIENLSEKEGRLIDRLNVKWQRYADQKVIDKGDVAENEHWLQGQPESYQIKEIHERILLKIALQIGLRDQEYKNQDHKEILTAYKKIASPAATMRYPRFEDTEYPEEVRKKFSVVYFAGLDTWESNLYINEYMMTPTLSISTIAKGIFGGLESTITKESKADEKITTDWSHSGSVSYGPFSVKASASNKEIVEEDFNTTTKMSVSVKSLIAIPYNASTWFTPSIFSNPIILSNRDVFERWLGEKGTLRIYPTHLVVCRGFSVTFENSQDWKHDYEGDFSVSGSGSASIFGIGFGGGSGYKKHVERQLVEKRGHKLTFGDGEDNVRIIGFHTVRNPILENAYDAHRAAFEQAEEEAKANLEALEEIERNRTDNT